MGRFENRVVLITGGATGIGRATALAFAREGARLVLGNRNVERGEAVAREIERAGGKAVFRATDVRSVDDQNALVALALDKFGRLDIAFNNAGVEGALVPTAEQTLETYETVMDINVRGVFLSMKAQIPAILKSGGGSIINNASVLGSTAMPNTNLYTASKHAVIGLSKSAALEYAKQGVRVNIVSPGTTQTEMFDRFTGESDDVKAGMAAMNPSGRIGRPEEIANAVLWLASDEASYVTGFDLRVDGGLSAQ